MRLCHWKIPSKQVMCCCTAFVISGLLQGNCRCAQSDMSNGWELPASESSSCSCSVCGVEQQLQWLFQTCGTTFIPREKFTHGACVLSEHKNGLRELEVMFLFLLSRWTKCDLFNLSLSHALWFRNLACFFFLTSSKTAAQFCEWHFAFWANSVQMLLLRTIRRELHFGYDLWQ